MAFFHRIAEIPQFLQLGEVGDNRGVMVERRGEGTHKYYLSFGARLWKDS